MASEVQFLEAIQLQLMCFLSFISYPCWELWFSKYRESLLAEDKKVVWMIKNRAYDSKLKKKSNFLKVKTNNWIM